jgi:FixJ family two-component response regulator
MSHSTIMVLDDDAATLEVIPYTLRRELPDLRVETIQSPLAALDRLKARDYGLLLTDLRMPEMDGLTVLREAKTVRPETPVILMSGLCSTEHLTAALGGGAFDFLPKTGNREEFARIVGLALETHQLRREVKARRLTVIHLNRQITVLELLLRPQEDRNVLPARIRDRVLASRCRTEHSLMSLELARIKTRARMVEDLLERAEDRLHGVVIEAQFRALKRFDTRVPSY